MKLVVILQACLLTMLLSSRTVKNEQTDGRVFNIVKGYRMSDPLVTHWVHGDSGRLRCVMHCQNVWGDEFDCSTVGYNGKTGQCNLHKNSLDDVHEVSVEYDNDWELLYHKGKDDWEVLMRLNAGSGVSPSRIWFGEVSPPPESLCNLPGNVNCSLNFRSGKIDNWDKLHITKVRIEFFTKLERVMFMTFNGTGSNSSSWFHNDRYLDSSWANIPHQSPFKHFSIKGEAPFVGRIFHVSDDENVCLHQEGWLVVLDKELHNHVTIMAGLCDWEQLYGPTPAFLYSPFDGPVVWQDTEFTETADVLVISFNRN